MGNPSPAAAVAPGDDGASPRILIPAYAGPWADEPDDGHARDYAFGLGLVALISALVLFADQRLGFGQLVGELLAMFPIWILVGLVLLGVRRATRAPDRTVVELDPAAGTFTVLHGVRRTERVGAFRRVLVDATTLRGVGTLFVAQLEGCDGRALLLASLSRHRLLARLMPTADRLGLPVAVTGDGLHPDLRYRKSYGRVAYAFAALSTALCAVAMLTIGATSAVASIKVLSAVAGATFVGSCTYLSFQAFAAHRRAAELRSG